MVAQITEKDFNEVIASPIPTVVYIWAPTCIPCRTVTPMVMELEEEMDQVTFVKVSGMENTQILLDFGLRSVPTFLIFKEGKLLSQRTGGHVTKSELKEFIKKAIA